MEPYVRSLVRKHRYNLRPDMSGEDVVQEAYFAYLLGCERVTRESVAERAGKPVDSVTDDDLARSLCGYLRKWVRTALMTGARSASRHVRMRRRLAQEPMVLTGKPVDWVSEAETRVAFDRLSDEAKSVFLSDSGYLWRDEDCVPVKRTPGAAVRRIGRLLDDVPTRYVPKSTLRRGSAVWDEIQTVMGFQEQ